MENIATRVVLTVLTCLLIGSCNQRQENRTSIPLSEEAVVIIDLPNYMKFSSQTTIPNMAGLTYRSPFNAKIFNVDIVVSKEPFSFSSLVEIDSSKFLQDLMLDGSNCFSFESSNNWMSYTCQKEGVKELSYYKVLPYMDNGRTNWIQLFVTKNVYAKDNIHDATRLVNRIGNSFSIEENRSFL